MKSKKRDDNTIPDGIIGVRDDKKYRYYFFDYLYYRLYLIYKNINETPRFSACILLTMNLLVIFLFFSIIFNCVLTDHWFSLKTSLSLKGIRGESWIGGNVFYHVVLRYTRKRTAAIL